jgi:hypothetical protein
VKNLILGLMFAAILLIPVGSQQVFAPGHFVDQNPPDFRGNDCSALFQFFSVPDPGVLVSSEGCAAFSSELSDFPLHQRCEEFFPEGSSPDSVVGLACHMEMPNFVDSFDTKLIRFQVVYTGVEPIINNVKPQGGDNCEQIGFGSSFNYFFADYICHPNPDNDRIWLELQPGTFILDALVDTWSFGKIVGGENLPIDSTALLLAAAQSPSAWVTSLAIAALGIGAYVFSRNPSNMRNIKVILRDYLDRL